MDMDAFMAFVGKFAGDLGAVVAAGNVVIGDRLGLYAGLAAGRPSTAAELAARTGTDARYAATRQRRRATFARLWRPTDRG